MHDITSGRQGSESLLLNLLKVRVYLSGHQGRAVLLLRQSDATAAALISNTANAAVATHTARRLLAAGLADVKLAASLILSVILISLAHRSMLNFLAVAAPQASMQAVACAEPCSS
jgi:hypothetical protein